MMRRIAVALERMRRRVHGGDDAGFTLAEVLVVMLVLGILTTAVSTMMITGMRTSKAAELRLDETNSARVGMESITRILRTAVLPSQLQATCGGCDTATAFIQGTPTKMAFYANINNPDNAVGPSKVIFEIDANGSLRQTVQPPDTASRASHNYTWNPCIVGQPSCLISTRVIAEGVSPTSALFTYYDEAGVPIPTPITAAQLGNVGSVDVTLTVQKQSNQDPMPVTFVNRVALPNADSIVKADDDT